jgi:hypothetical protein
MAAPLALNNNSPRRRREMTGRYRGERQQRATTWREG